MELVLPTPSRFNFRRTVLSHGWALLPPFELDQSSWTLRRVVTLPGRKPVVLAMHGVPRHVAVTAEPARLSSRATRELGRQVTAMLGLAVDLEPFYKTAARHADLKWVGRAGAGRMLRAPTVFEDVTKLLITTNCSWSATQRMTKALVDLGERAGGDRRAFPSPAAVAQAGEPYMKDVVRAGYRSMPLVALAESVASGQVDIESWVDLPAAEVRQRALRLRGVGPYVADNLLGLLGRGRGLGIDSWVRATLAGRTGRDLTDAEIAERYSPYGEHAGLALWCDVTKDWLDQAPALIGER